MSTKWRSNGFLGNPTVGCTVLDRAARRVLQTSDSPASTLDALSVSVNGLTLTNITATGVTTSGATYPVAYAYDAFGRMVAMATTRDPAQESVNLLTLLPQGLTLASAFSLQPWT